ncbi:MAG: hypothetical protein ACYTAN_15970 [Planctomycetota bacterium]
MKESAAYCFYGFLVDPSNRFEAAVLVALYLAAPLTVAAVVLIRNGKKGIGAVFARPVYVASPFLAVAAVPALAAYAVCATLLTAGDATGWFKRVNDSIPDLVFFPSLALWPALVLVALAIESEARRSRVLRFAFVGGLLAMCAAMLGGHRHIWSERIFVDRDYIIDAPLVLAIGNLSAAAILPGMLIGAALSRMIPDTREAGESDSAEMPHRGPAASHPGPGLFTIGLVVALAAALGLSGARLRPVYNRWVSYANAEARMAGTVFPARDENLRKALSIVHSRGPLQTPFLLSVDMGPSRLVGSKPDAPRDILECGVGFEWLAEDFNVAGLTVSLVDADGRITSTVGHPCFATDSETKMKRWRARRERYRPLIQGTHIVLGFTTDSFKLEEVERVWWDRPERRPVFLLPLDDNAAVIRVELYTFESKVSNIAEIEIRDAFLCLEAASGSLEALKTLFSERGRGARADRFAHLFVVDGVLDLDWPRDSRGVRTGRMTAARVNEWLEKNEGRIHWDPERQAWATGEDQAEPPP